MGNNGAFKFKISAGEVGFVDVFCIASDGKEWEHVSVTIVNIKRCPTWEEMCFIKDLFWDNEDFVVQMHPPTEDYINCHPFCLHLWRKADTNDFCERPPKILVGA